MIRVLFVWLFISGTCVAQTHPYRDLAHDSKVFGRSKTFRLYLPENYEQSTERYPVIYFFHGWGGRYFKDESAKLEYDRLGRLVDKYRVILVMWDGSMDESEPRPYNVGNHEDVKYPVQIKDYFPELVDYIDTTCRTLADRTQRGIIGFSMGGFTAAFLAGKYPDKVSAMVDMVGSPEFFVGYPDNHTLYPIRYTFDNLKEVSLRFHNMDNCPLYYMNTEVRNAAAWEGLTNFEYELGKGDHKVDEPGETKVFEKAMQFIRNRFNNPIPLGRTRSHYDLYPAFDVWGYSVKSNRKEPGFIYLRNVSPAGFGFYTCKWLPDGPSIPDCRTTVVTPPIYKKKHTYDIALYRQGLETPVISREKTDADGRLHIELTGEGYEVSISHPSQPADMVTFGYQLDHDRRFVRVNEENELRITFLNRGGDVHAGKNVQLTVSCTDKEVYLSNTVQELRAGKGEKVFHSLPVSLSCNKAPPGDGSPPWLRFNVQLRCGDEVFSDAMTVPVFYDVPYFSHIRIDDENRNGQVEPSERIKLSENYRRLRLYTDDPYVESAAETLDDEMLPAIWPDGFTLSSVVKIAGNCPSGHTIEFLACYETKTFMPIHREVHWGRVNLLVNSE
jgi:pimeloyl-ACP methyl ester carboxylesterase